MIYAHLFLTTDRIDIVKDGVLTLETLNNEAGAISFSVPVNIPIVPLTFLMCEEV